MVLDPVLVKEWMPAMASHDLHDAPVQVTVLGERVVLFRSDGEVAAFKDLCVHRGAALSLGKVMEDGCLVCPYHGWTYDSSGQCVHIPQQPKGAAISPKAKAVAYLAQEAYGIVWVNLTGDPEQAEPLPVYDEFADPGMRTVLSGPYEVHAAAPRLVENFLDISHLAFVHDGYLGYSGFPEISDYHVHWDKDGIVSDEIAITQPDPSGGEGDVVTHQSYRILRPTVARLRRINKDTGEVLAMLFAALPQGERTTQAIVLNSRNYLFEKTDQELRDRQRIIFNQDLAIVENQKPEELPLDLQAELHLKADRLSIAYRQWLGELGVALGTSPGRPAERR